MAAIGNSPTQQAFTPAIDYFSGNGSTTAFTLSRPVASVAQVQVTIDNVAQNPSSAYTVSANTITFTSAPLSGTNNIYVYYTSPITQVIAPSQGTVQTAQLGNITNIASGNSSLTLQTGSSPTTAITVTTAQNVGIGTTSPTALTSNKALTINSPTGFGSLLDLKTNETLNLRVFSNASNSGLSVKTATPLLFDTNDTERMRIASSGEVLIGGTAQGRETNLSVDGTYQDPTGVWAQVGIYSTDTQAANKGGTIGFGGQDGSVSKQQFAAIKGAKENSTSANYAGYMAFYTRPAGDVTTERMRIDSGGSLCIGNSGNFGARVNITFDPASTNGLLFAVSSGTFTNNYIYFQNSGGSKIGSVSSNNSSVTYNTTSDYRIKTNVQPITGALSKVAQLKPVTYDWKPEFAEGSSQGFIAHELQAVVPDCVTGAKDAVDADGNPQYQGIDTSFLVATLTAAIQELSAKNDALTARIEALENR